MNSNENQKLNIAVDSLIIKTCEAAEIAVANNWAHAPELVRSVAGLIEVKKKYLG